MPEQGDVRNQIVISFDVNLAAHPNALTTAKDLVDKAVKQLENYPVTVLGRFIAETSDSDAFFAVIVARLDSPTLTIETLQADEAFLKISHIERDAPIALAGYNDPLLAEQWALARLGADQPWSVAPPGANKTIVGIVDSGLYRADANQPLHVDLDIAEPRLDCQPQPVFDAFGNVLFPGMHLDSIDQDGHGTLLAGTIAALPGNAQGVSSAVQHAWNIRLLPVKFFGPAAGPSAAYAAIGIAHAIDKRAKVINASWHVASGDPDLWVLKLALEFADDVPGIVRVFAEYTARKQQTRTPSGGGRMRTAVAVGVGALLVVVVLAVLTLAGVEVPLGFWFPPGVAAIVAFLSLPVWDATREPPARPAGARRSRRPPAPPPP